LEKYLETEIKKGRKIKKKLRMQPQINKTLKNNKKYLKTNSDIETMVDPIHFFTGKPQN
jgi:hypothetical protein